MRFIWFCFLYVYRRICNNRLSHIGKQLTATSSDGLPPRDSIRIQTTVTITPKISSSEIITAMFILIACLVVFFWQPIITKGTLLPVANIFEQPFYRPYAPAGFVSAPNVALSDQSLQLYPVQHFTMQSLKAGHLPLWNPYIMLGTSVLGTTQAALFYPLNLLGVVLSPTTVPLIRAFFNLWIAGFFTYLLLRRLGAHPVGAYLSAIAFMFSGFLVVWLGHPHSNVAVWLPVLIYMAELIITSRRFRGEYVAITGLVIGLIFLGGHMETAFEVGIAWVAFYIIRSYQTGGWRNMPNKLLVCGIASVLGIAMAAIQIIPFLEWLGTSVALAIRSSEPFTVYDWNHLKQLPTLAALIIPNLYINPSQVSIYRTFVPWGNFNEMAAYVGIIPLVFGILGVVWAGKRENKYVFLFGVGGLLFLFLALRLPIIDWINQLPLFKMFAPRRYRLVFDFGIAVAAGLTFDMWLYRSSVGKNWSRMSLVLFVIGGIIFICTFLVGLGLFIFEKPLLDYGNKFTIAEYAQSSMHSRPLDKVLLDVDQIYKQFVRYFGVGNWRLYFPGIVACLGAVLILNWRKGRIGRRSFQYGLLGLTLIDLFVFGIGFNPTIHPEHVYPDTPAVRFLKQDSSIFRILPVRMEWMSNGPLAHDLSEMGGADIPTKYYADFTDIIEGKDGKGFMFFTAQSANSKLIDLLNVKYLVTTRNLDGVLRKEFQSVWHQDGVNIYENRVVMPRAFIVHRIHLVTDNNVLQVLQQPSFDPASEVLLFEDHAKEVSVENILSTEETVEVLSYKPQHIRLKVKIKADGILVLSDSYYPGWRAYRDGVEVPIYRANCVMRAVSVPKGDHDIEFVYRPLSVYLGGIVSLSALCVSGWMAVASLVNRKKGMGSRVP